MRIVTIQNKVFETVNQNIDHLQKLLDNSCLDKVDFIVLPEMFTTPYEMAYFKKNKQEENGLVISFLKQVAKKHHTYIVCGSIPEVDGNKLYNTSFVLDRQGKIIAKYRKIHLFSVTYPNGQRFDEADTLSKGHQVVTFDSEFGRMGIMICFDIRFPLLARKLREMGSLIIFVPAAFNTFTGPMHWHTTFKARAIDNQLFMVGASPARTSFGSYHVYGHSLVVDPLGKIIKELDESEDLLSVDVNLIDIEKARKSIPIVTLDHGDDDYETL